MVVQIMKSYFCLPSFIVSSLKNEILTHNFVFPFLFLYWFEFLFILISISLCENYFPNSTAVFFKIINESISLCVIYTWIYNIYTCICQTYYFHSFFSQLTNEKNKVICENFKMNDANLHVTVLYISESRPTLWNTLQLEILF